jgi:hypothetical protein
MLLATTPATAGNLLVAARERRKRLLARMAADLVRCETYADQRAARRTLSCLGYATADIVMLIDDARALATQEAVRAAMVMP